jgi:hypothetical protein
MQQVISNQGGQDLAYAPFHGAGEKGAQIIKWCILLEAAMAIAFPWLVFLVRPHHPTFGRYVDLPSFGALCFIDCLGLVAALGFLDLYKRLSSKIAEGGPESVFLDRVRSSMTLMVQLLLALGMTVVSHLR